MQIETGPPPGEPPKEPPRRNFWTKKRIMWGGIFGLAIPPLIYMAPAIIDKAAGEEAALSQLASDGVNRRFPPVPLADVNNAKAVLRDYERQTQLPEEDFPDHKVSAAQVVLYDHEQHRAALARARERTGAADQAQENDGVILEGFALMGLELVGAVTGGLIAEYRGKRT